MQDSGTKWQKFIYSETAEYNFHQDKMNNTAKSKKATQNWKNMPFGARQILCSAIYILCP